MKTTKTLRCTVLAVAGAATALAALAPTVASAQSYGAQPYDNQNGYYDACRRDQNQRAVVGGLLGAVAGMALGNNSSDRRYRRHDNAALGTVIGGVAGAGIGASTAGCTPAPRQQTYYAPAPAYSYADPRYDQRDYYDRYAYAPPAQSYAPPPAYDDYDYAPQRPPLACTYVESPVRMPDGRSQKRMVQVCPDSQGRYQIVE